MFTVLSKEEKANRQEYAEAIKRRVNRLSVKQCFFSELIGVRAGHFCQMLIGVRPLHRYKDKIEIILEELEKAEQNIKQRLQL